MIRAVIDTSVLIRYLIRPSAAIRELIETYWLGDRVQMVTAPELLAELEQVLRREHMQAFIRPDEGQALLEVVRHKAEQLAPLGPIPPYSRDAKDDKFIACALAGEAEYVITTDADLLVLGALAGVRLVTPAEFVLQFAGAHP